MIREYSFHWLLQVRHTANMWLDMVDPYLVWSKLFGLMDTRYPGKGSTGEPDDNNYKQELDDLLLILFLLQNFKMADEEIQQMHLPLFLAAAVQKLEVSEGDAWFKTTIAIYWILMVSLAGSRQTAKLCFHSCQV